MIGVPHGGRKTMTQQTELRFPIPSVNAPGEAILGEVCPPSNCGAGQVALDVWRYLKDTSGRQTTYIKRAKGRPVKEIACDLSLVIKDMTCEWDTLGQPFNFNIGGFSRETECPDHNGLAVYTTHGGSEGHLVHVELRIQPEPGEPGSDGTSMRHMTLFMVKVLTGIEDARAIQHKLEEVLGVL